MENPPRIEKEIDLEERKNLIFNEIIIDKLVSSFIVELENLDFGDNEIDAFSSAVVSEGDENYLLNILAIPKEIRNRWILEAKSKGLGGKELFYMLKNKYEMIISMQDGKRPIVGFHTSGEDIPYSNKDSKNTWQIQGTESSDLGEGLLAYASDSYESLYKDRSPEFLYVVRILDTDKKYGQGETSWYWNRNFPIVEKFRLHEIESELKQKLSETEIKKAA